MSIQLDNTWKAGSVGNMAEYGEAKIVQFRIGVERHQSVDIILEAGDTVDDVWVPGENGKFKISLRDNPRAELTEYTDFVVANSGLLRSLKQQLYQVAQAKYAKLAGDIA
jgi:hypothetical protein